MHETIEQATGSVGIGDPVLVAARDGTRADEVLQVVAQHPWRPLWFARTRRHGLVVVRPRPDGGWIAE